MPLEKELATYRSKLPELKVHEGKFVLIHGEEVVDFFSTYEDAIKSGYQKYKLEPFLVKQVHATEPVFFISRNVMPTTIAPSKDLPRRSCQGPYQPCNGILAQQCDRYAAHR